MVIVEKYCGTRLSNLVFEAADHTGNAGSKIHELRFFVSAKLNKRINQHVWHGFSSCMFSSPLTNQLAQLV